MTDRSEITGSVGLESCDDQLSSTHQRPIQLDQKQPNWSGSWVLKVLASASASATYFIMWEES